MSTRIKLLTAAAAVLALGGCGKLGDILSPSQSQVVIIGATPLPSPSPSASPSPGGGLVRPASVRVAFFGGSCPSGSGKTFPTNGLGQVPVSCTGFATATPKAADGTDLTPAQHGPDIAWSLSPASGIVDVTGHRVVRAASERVTLWGESSTQEPFNRDVRGLAVGAFHLCATVQGVTGCLDGSVI